MSVNLPNKGNLDARIGTVSLDVRNALRECADLYQNLAELGSDQLVDLGYTSDDAANLLTVFYALSQLSSAYQGGAYAGPALPFNFMNATAGWWNGN